MEFNSFGQRLRAARLRRRLSLRQLSSAAGLSYSQISRLERQRHAVRADDVEKLARALGTSLQELMGTESLPERAALPLVPGAAQDQAASYPVMRLTRLAPGRRMNLSRIARASPSWTGVMLKGKVHLSGPGLSLVVSAGAKLSRKVLTRYTVHAQALEPSELVWLEHEAAQGSRGGDVGDELEAHRQPLKSFGRKIGYLATRALSDAASVVSALREAGCSSVHHDVIESHALARPELLAAIGALEPTDVLVSPGVQSLGLRTHEILEMISGIDEVGARFVTLDGDIDTRRPGTIEAIRGLAKLEPNPRSSRVSAGMLAAGAAGSGERGMGRPPALNGVQIEQLRRLVEAGLSTGQIRQQLGFTKSTVERYVRRIREGVL